MVLFANLLRQFLSRHQYVSPWRAVLCRLFGKPWSSAIRQRVARPMLLM